MHFAGGRETGEAAIGTGWAIASGSAARRFDERRVVPTLDALLTTPAGTAKDIAKVQNRLTAVSRAQDCCS